MIKVNAVLGKELTTRMRGWRSAAVITGYLALLATVSFMYLSSKPTPQTYGDQATVGRELFQWLAAFQMVLIVLITPTSTADAISGERQRQTLELLLVTRLSSLSIVLGKLVAGLAFDLLLILCSLPLFSLVFLFGGVSPDEFVSVFVVFLATALLLGSMSLFISTIVRRGSIAVGLLCTLGVTVGLILVSFYIGYLEANAPTASSPLGGPGAPALPFTLYLDPLAGFAGAIPGLGILQGLSTFSIFTGGPLHLSLWEDQVIADLLLSGLFIAGSVRLLRPRWSPDRSRRAARPARAEGGA